MAHGGVALAQGGPLRSQVWCSGGRVWSGGEAGMAQRGPLRRLTRTGTRGRTAAADAEFEGPGQGLAGAGGRRGRAPRGHTGERDLEAMFPGTDFPRGGVRILCCHLLLAQEKGF